MFSSSGASLTVVHLNAVVVFSFSVVFVVIAVVNAFPSSYSSTSSPLDQDGKDAAETRHKLRNGHDLLLVQVLIRHGDRTPISLEPANPYDRTDFFEGLGELTNVGKARIFKYGQVLAKRYEIYFENFFVRNIRAQSSPIRRCLETHEALMAGMLPPQQRNVWNENPNDPIGSRIAKLWNPIGISTVEEGRSWKTNPDAPCPVADKIVRDFNMTNKDLNDFFMKNKDFRERVEKYSRQTIHSWKFYGYLYDNIFAEMEYFRKYFKWPKWLDEVGKNTLEKLKEFNDLNFSIFSQASEELFRLRTGALMKEMVENMKEAAKTVSTPWPSKRKLFSYTSHDVMVGYLMNMFGAFKEQPSYGSGLLLELRRNFHTQEPMVHLFYANVTNNNEIYRLKLNEISRFKERCTDSRGACSLENFAASLANITNVDPEEDCFKMEK